MFSTSSSRPPVFRPAAAIAIGSLCLTLLLAVCWGATKPRTVALQTSGRSSAEVTYTHDIAPIMDAQCVTCHRSGQVAPFALTDYETAREHAQMLAIVTAKHVMPPWRAAAGYGDFQGVRGLTDVQIATLQKWVDEGEPEGRPSDLPPAPKFASEWSLGQPDLVLSMPEAFSVPATGNDIYQCFVLPTGIADDRFVAAIELKPGNPKVVHHAIAYLDSRHVAQKLLNPKDPGAGFLSFGGPGFLPTGVLGGWAPGAFPHLWPAGIADYMAGGSDVVLQVHYHPDGKPETDQSKIGIYFAKGPITAVTTDIALWQPNIDIPPGDSDYTRTQEFTTPVDCDAVGIIPHMHLLGRQMKVTAYLPDGTVKPMVWVKDWNFNWQDQYRYKSPVFLPAGTRLELTAAYDNSDNNPFNPNSPPKEVHLGEQTTDEMCLCVVQVVTKTPADRVALVRSVIRSFVGVGRALNAGV
jgi:hypothetical protein